MKYQRFVSLTAGLSFVLIFISSGVLYFIPDRGVTGWTAWTFLGLDKQQWDNVHINLGILFLVILVWHIYYNWKPLKAYLKVKKEWKVFTKEFNVALIVTILFLVGTITMTPPWKILVNVGNGIKAMNAKDVGNPPFDYAEYATLEDFCLIAHIDQEEALKKLQSKRMNVPSTALTLKKIAAVNQTRPKRLFQIIRNPKTKFSLPSDLPIGIAKKTLKRLEEEYTIVLEKFIQHLAHYGIEATPESTFKKLAMDNHLHPAELYNMLLASQYM